jgi:maltose O-acetyltransferase
MDPTPELNLRLHAATLLVSRLPPFVASRVRSRALRAAGLKLGTNSVFWDVPTIIGPPSRLHIGDSCGFNSGSFFDLHDEVFIADHVSVGHDVMFLTHTFAQGDSSRRAGRQVQAPIRVNSGAWLGARVTVMPGVTIGEGAVIGASVVVDKDVPPNTLVMGAQKISLAKWRTKT